jgi:hypothetical protein
MLVVVQKELIGLSVGLGRHICPIDFQHPAWRENLMIHVIVLASYLCSSHIFSAACMQFKEKSWRGGADKAELAAHRSVYTTYNPNLIKSSFAQRHLGEVGTSTTHSAKSVRNLA